MSSENNIWYGIATTIIIGIIAYVVFYLFGNAITQFIVWLSGNAVAEFLVIFLVLMCVNLWLSNIIHIWKRN
ncbi:MAG: hypothetical protein WC974_04550 [Thermoplasmata archaeon]